MTDDLVTVEHVGAVAVVHMNATQKRNALNLPLVEALVSMLGSLQDLGEARAIVLSGGKHFCAGGDLSTLGVPPIEMRRFMQVGHRIVRTLTSGRLPVVAAVQGNAYGAGFSIAMACDFVIAEATTSFCAAFGRVGLTPDYGLLWTLPQRVGMGKAREIVMLCDPISGPEAADLGLVDHLAPDNAVPQAALKLAIRLAAAPPATIATTKSVLSRAPLSLDTMLAWEADTQSVMTTTKDFAEGIESFRAKRPPTFRGS